jgi:putative ABC transport system permease protein
MMARMHDLRTALRALVARPGFAIVAILTLALGIGANTAVFTVVNGVLLAPLPYAEPARVAVLLETTPKFPMMSVSYQNYVDWRDRSRSFDAVAAFRSTSLTITGAGGEPERLPAKMVTATLLPTLGVQPSAGRGFNASDDQRGAAGVVVLSDAFAKRRFGSGTESLGRAITLDNEPRTIVGVLPAGFELFQAADVYVPMGPWAATLPDDRGWHPGIMPVGRLRTGVSFAQARTEMTTIAQQLETEYPNFNRGTRALVTPLLDQVVQNVRPALLVLLGAVSLVLLIACANVANLLLARAVSRQKEIAVRTALGASRGRIVRQLVVESLLLAVIGGTVGMLVASWGVSLLMRFVTTGLPRIGTIGIDWSVLSFAIGVSVATGLIFGLVPALQATRFDIRETLNEAGRGGGANTLHHQRLRAALVIAEVALALMLLVSAGLLMRSFARMQHVDPGFDPHAMLVIDLPLSPITYARDDARDAVVERVIARVRALPAVRAAAITTVLPMTGGGTTLHFNIAGRPPKGPDDYIVAGYRAISAGYFQTMGMPLRHGRAFSPSDREGTPAVVIINESLARQFFDGRNPLGQRLQVGTEPDPAAPFMEVVGVVRDVKQSFEAGAKAEMYVPYGQHPDPVLAGMYRNVSLVVRTDLAPATLVGSVRKAITEIDPNQPLVRVRTMEDAIGDTVAQPRLQSALLTIFATIAVALALVGVYGVMAYSVSRRTQEIGVRIALGASSQDVVRMIVGQGARLAAIGIALGLIGAWGAIRGLLFNASGPDWLIFTAAPLTLAFAAILASYIPARRAARVSPIAALGSGDRT